MRRWGGVRVAVVVIYVAMGGMHVAAVEIQ
jgi:hypothetical protein